ncbi:uncharacterized protein LOC141705060 [Apium graveolens]|uniref:uncharacterized protein LOC141705060 n=1 Tax=Apium graveolens TaxID=4045 RepID=UPI003D79DAB5
MAMCLQTTILDISIGFMMVHTSLRNWMFLLLVRLKRWLIKKKRYNAEDLASIMKNAKVRYFLHRSLDIVISNRVIGCKTVKEIWETLEVKYQSTTTVKKNRKTILTHEYEQFDSKADESLTEIYDRFQKLLNDRLLVDKEYDPKDLNLKFLLALPEKWDLKVTSI